jgi:hypothetical protein
MAIDQGSDPSHMKNSLQQSSPKPTLPVATSSQEVGAGKSSSSSLASWPEVVENMHQGRPAHASEDDPFGSRSQLASWRRTGGRGEGGSRGRGLSGSEKTQGERIFMTEPSPAAGQGGERKEEGERGDYKPSFGRRATQNGHSSSQNTLPPTAEKTVTERLVSAPSPSVSRGLLPRRPKADNAVMRSHEGAIISEPDDLEELVL